MAFYVNDYLNGPIESVVMSIGQFYIKFKTNIITCDNYDSDTAFWLTGITYPEGGGHMIGTVFVNKGSINLGGNMNFYINRFGNIPAIFNDHQFDKVTNTLSFEVQGLAIGIPKTCQLHFAIYPTNPVIGEANEYIYDLIDTALV